MAVGFFPHSRLLFPLATFAAMGMTLLAVVRPAHASAPQSCATCDPNPWIERAESQMLTSLHIILRDGGLPEDTSSRYVVEAELASMRGQGQKAFGFARHAAAECLLQGGDSCGEAIALLADLSMGLGTPETEQAALGFLALIPYAQLRPTDCARALVLRYRLHELHAPKTARGRWADQCGATANVGELGYRAAKAALLRGDLAQSARRLSDPRAFGPTFSVRGQYLRAVWNVASGHIADATGGFARLVALPPVAARSEEEEDARILASLQLARLEREAGHYRAALDAYRHVPSMTAARPDALLEAVVVAAHIGDLGAARAYLDALDTYAPKARSHLNVERLRGSLAVMEAGDEEEARKTFANLSKIGRQRRAALFGPGAVDVEEQLKDEPSLGGLLDPVRAGKVGALQADVAALETALSRNQKEIKALYGKIAQRGPAGPLRDALDGLNEADALLRRAENIVSLRMHQGIHLAGPASSALALTARVARLRQTIDAQTTRVRAAQRLRQQRILAQLDEVTRGTQIQLAALRGVQTRAGIDLAAMRRTLVARALLVIARLEMSEEIGPLELIYRKKALATARHQQLSEEHAVAVASVKSDIK